MPRLTKQSSGFTMIEMIFVIVVLGILAAVALPKFMGVSNTNLKSYHETWEHYKDQEPYSAIAIESLVETGGIAVTLEGLPILGVRSAIIYLAGTSIKAVPKQLLTRTRGYSLFITRPAYEVSLLSTAKLTVVNGTRIAKRDHIFEPSRSNIKRMKSGQAPIGRDGSSVELHHLRQKNNLIVIEVLGDTEHKKYSNLLHDSAKASEIDREDFNRNRPLYWKERAKDFDCWLC